jgi:hypothetical protein
MCFVAKIIICIIIFLSICFDFLSIRSLSAIVPARKKCVLGEEWAHEPKVKINGETRSVVNRGMQMSRAVTRESTFNATMEVVDFPIKQGMKEEMNGRILPIKN